MRNKIRHDLLPVIEAINPDYRPTFTSTIFRLKQAEQIYRKQIKSEENNLIEKDKDTTRINIEKLSHLNPIETYLFELIEPFGFKFPAVYDIIHSITTEPGKKFHSPTHRMIRDREYFIIKPIEKNPQNHQIYLIEREDKEVMEPVNLKIQQFAKPANFTPPVEPEIAALDYDQIKFPLRIRKWQNGDTFYPIGMQQKKLLSDFFIDNKFSLDEKEKTWLLVSGSQIAWIIGHRIDDRFKITHTTKVIQQFNLF